MPIIFFAFKYGINKYNKKRFIKFYMVLNTIKYS